MIYIVKLYDAYSSCKCVERRVQGQMQYSIICRQHVSHHEVRKRGTTVCRAVV